MGANEQGIGEQPERDRRVRMAAKSNSAASPAEPALRGQDQAGQGDLEGAADAQAMAPVAAAQRLQEMLQRDAAAQRAIQEMLQRDAAAQHDLQEMLQRDAAARRALQELLQSEAGEARLQPGPVATQGWAFGPRQEDIDVRQRERVRPPVSLPQEEESQRAIRFRERVVELIRKFQQQLPANKQLEVLYFLKNGQGLRVVAIEPLAGGSVLLIGDVATVMVDVSSIELVFQVTTTA
jgi:hypothetical protein